MKRIITIALVSAIFTPAIAAAEAKPCDELKNEIAAKLDKKGVKGYTLEVTSPAQVVDAKMIVGSCEGGSKRIIYINKR